MDNIMDDRLLAASAALEGRITTSEQNRVAGAALEYMRGWAKKTQVAFAAELGLALGTSIDQRTLSGWERGVRQVPAAALIAASQLTGVSLDVAVDGGAGPGGLEALESELNAIVAVLSGAQSIPKTREERAKRINDLTRQLKRKAGI